MHQADRLKLLDDIESLMRTVMVAALYFDAGEIYARAYIIDSVVLPAARRHTAVEGFEDAFQGNPSSPWATP